MAKKTQCGYIAIIGRPNAGKSTLLNAFLGRKLSIISRKPQTTRHKILGIKTVERQQLVFVDTPGVHRNPRHEINKLMIRSALSAIRDVDIIIFMLNKYDWTVEEDAILQKLAKTTVPIIVAINKIDRVKNKDVLLPCMRQIEEQFAQYHLRPHAIVPLSAKNHKGVTELEQLLLQLLPEGPHYFPADQVSDRNDRFWTTEIIREKLMRLLGEEIPHTLTVEIEQWQQEPDLLRVSALIWVEREGQKAIVIGEGGERLKQVGRLARLEMEREFKQKVFLKLWVKVKAGWTDDKSALRSFGYGD